MVKNSGSRGPFRATIQTTKPLQSPYRCFALRGARSGWVLDRFIHHPLTVKLPSSQIARPHLTPQTRFSSGRWIKRLLLKQTETREIRELLMCASSAVSNDSDYYCFHPNTSKHQDSSKSLMSNLDISILERSDITGFAGFWSFIDMEVSQALSGLENL